MAAKKKALTSFPATVGVGVLASLSGMSERRVQQLADEGILKKPEVRGEYPFEESLRALFAHLRELADGKPAQRAADLARSARAEADTKERERDLLFKRAIPFPLVQLAWAAVGAELRSGIMEAKIAKRTKVELVKRLRALAPRDYFKLGKAADVEEDED